MKSADEWLREAKRASYMETECPAMQWLAERLAERDAWWREIWKMSDDTYARAMQSERWDELHRLLGLDTKGNL